jgi:hypothetical protein
MAGSRKENEAKRRSPEDIKAGLIL